MLEAEAIARTWELQENMGLQGRVGLEALDEHWVIAQPLWIMVEHLVEKDNDKYVITNR